ncbi:MAG: hypothetical protein IT317_05500 [Anaerolineales bacterium]|nr:hypothetical protein [Anaerolineales bacterium]
MPSHTFTSLAATLAAAGHPLLELSAPDRGALLVLPFGGRILGLFSEPDGDNYLWTHPALDTAASARDFFAAPGWRHFGGDRIWVSPEVETHIGDLADPWNTYAPAVSVDPGDYSASARPGAIDLSNRAVVRFLRAQLDVPLQISRSVRLLADPLRTVPELAALPGVTYAGYEQSSTLRLEAPASAPLVSLWSLAVVPVAGWMIVPTPELISARDFFVPTPSERLISTPHAVHFRIDGQEQHKIGLPAAALLGRAGYLRALGPGRRSLLVRQWVVNPSADYTDTPWEARHEPGYAFESYNEGPSLPAFGELEYHTLAIGGATDQAALTDVSQLWAYAGPAAAIEAIGRRLLGVDTLPVMAD